MTQQEEINEFIRRDAFAARLGATIEEIRPGYSRVRLPIQSSHHNFHGMTHGGVVFGLADIAFAAASNSRGQMAVALDMAVTFLKATADGDELVAEATEIQLNGPIGLYEILVRTQPQGELVARLQATVYRKKNWFVEQKEQGPG